MIKINGKSGELDVTGTVKELTVEIAMVIYYLAVDYQQNKNMPLEDSISYFTNRVKAKIQELKEMKDDERNDT